MGMTREEAREFLIDISYKLGNMSVEYLSEKDGEKMRESIKVLEQESRWIPISERLPEEKQMVWVKSNDMYLKKINPCIGWRNGFYWRTYTANGVHIIQYPIAWKSYKLESEE